MRRVFVDSGGFFALLVSEDAFHARAMALLTQATKEAWSLITTNAVVYETHALLNSLCDALSFVVMERLDIQEAIAFDRHFREYGKVTML